MAIKHTSQTINGVNTEVLGKTVRAIQDDPSLGASHFRVTNTWVSGNRNRTTVEGFYTAGEEHAHAQGFQLFAGEPPMLAGDDSAPNPVEHLLNALGACLTTSMVAHAAVRGIRLKRVEARIEGDIDLRGFLGLDENVPRGYTDIRVDYRVQTDEPDIDRLQELAEYSPVFNTISQGANVTVTVRPE